MEHPITAPADEQVVQIVATGAHYLEYALVHGGGTAFEEEFGSDPY